MNTNEYISLIDIIKMLKRRAGLVFFITMLCTSFMLAKVMFLSTPTYEASTTAVIVKEDSDAAKNSKYTQGDIELYQKIVNTYVQIAQSNIVIEKTAEELGTYSPDQIREMVSAAPSGETQIIKLKVKSRNRNDVADIANIYCKVFIEQSMNKLPVGKIEVLDPARIPKDLALNYKLINIIIAFMFGLVLSIGIVIFKYYLECQKIKSEEQVKNILNIPVLVTIE